MKALKSTATRAFKSFLGGAALGAASLVMMPGVASAADCSLLIKPKPGHIPAAKLVSLDQNALVTVTFCNGSAGYKSQTFLLRPDKSETPLGLGNVTPAGTSFCP